MAEKTMDRATIERVREETLDQLAFAKQRRRQVTEAFAIGKATEQHVAEADQSVHSAERKLEGLGYHQEKVDAKEREAEEAEKAANRRERAVEILSLMHLRHWAVETLDKGVASLRGDIARVDELGQQITLISQACFAGDSLGKNHLLNFLGGIGASGLTDIVYRVEAHIDRDAGGYAQGLPFSRQQALRALATALPEVMDDAVQKEALERARSVIEAQPRSE